MIDFHIERGGVPPYLQLVQHVKQALRLGSSSRATSCRLRSRSRRGGREPEHRAEGLQGAGAGGPCNGTAGSGHLHREELDPTQARRVFDVAAPVGFLDQSRRVRPVSMTTVSVICLLRRCATSARKDRRDGRGQHPGTGLSVRRAVGASRLHVRTSRGASRGRGRSERRRGRRHCSTCSSGCCHRRPVRRRSSVRSPTTPRVS